MEETCPPKIAPRAPPEADRLEKANGKIRREMAKAEIIPWTYWSFDYLSGRIPRAPKQVQNLGLEWLFRLIRQPRRWRRQLALIMFIFLIVKERLGLHK